MNEDRSPHVTAVGALWLDGAFWFQTGSGTRKSRNVGRDPRCSIAVSIRDAEIVIEGDAARVTDPAMLAQIADSDRTSERIRPFRADSLTLTDGTDRRTRLTPG